MTITKKRTRISKKRNCISKKRTRIYNKRNCISKKRNKNKKKNTIISSCPIPKAVLKDETLFTEQYGNYIPTCNKCFPLNILSSKLCLPQCYFPWHTDNPNEISSTVEQINSFYQGKDETKKPSQPYFIIGFGPPASGKSSILDTLNRLRKKLKINKNNTIVVDVDKIFQSTKQWEKQKKEIESIFKNSVDKHEAIQKLYTTYRFFSDQIADQISFRAAAERWNIYWETTGWSLGTSKSYVKMFHNMNYKVICVYPFVFQDMILERLRKRAIEEGQPPKGEDGVKDNIGRALDNLMKLKESGIDEIIFVDNTGKKGDEKIIFYIEQNPKTKKYITKCGKCHRDIHTKISERGEKKEMFNKPKQLLHELNQCCLSLQN